MKTIELSYPHQLTELPRTVAAIGFFDGIHKGHQKVISEAVDLASEINAESAVITFHPHPSVVLNKSVKHVKYITPLESKQKILNDLHVDRVYIIGFDQQLSKLSPQEFIDHFIIGLNIEHLVAGFDYSYGYKGEGNMENIKDFTRDSFTYSIVDKVELAEEKISSTKIRQLLKDGEISAVNSLLGRNLFTKGTVVEGDKRGRTIGYPTANLEVNAATLLPKSGVYAVTVVHRNKTYFGMANLGVKPTFTMDVETPSIEANIFDFEGDLYGEELIVEWHQFIRDEKKFAGVESLVDQIKEDEITIREFFKQVNLT